MIQNDLRIGCSIIFSVALVMTVHPRVRIGGVPEHYNAPFKKCEKLFEWTSYPGGTGAMLEALEKNEIDIAVVLTEGAVKHSISSKGSTRILGTFVNNPLPWGVHVSPSSGIQCMSDFNSRISQLNFGISRFGSGSHLMAIVHAATLGLPAPQFRVVNNMDGAAKCMEANEIDTFLWDIPTADKYTQKGVWNVIGQVSGDWPSFVLVVRQDVPEVTLKEIVEIVDQVRHAANQITSGPIDLSAQYLCDEYKLTRNQAEQFLEKISWNCSFEVSKKVIETVKNSLRVSGIIDGSESQHQIVHSRCREVDL